MKITSQEEYGLRVLLRIAKCRERDGMTIQALSFAEGLSTPYVAKLTRMLRMAGYINSTPGNKGGYILSRPAAQININEALKILGGSLFEKAFCEDYSGILKFCTNSVDCSIRSLWQMVQITIDNLLDKITLEDLIGSEMNADQLINTIIEQNIKTFMAGNGKINT
ncbi:RrF2 family transcriptional regulator [Mucilaginibacter ginsenosidivorans]|jgi:Rrf2 family protein|uniref:Rrf2 family transcriptional regulator n=1 Tax=Mucilaginibacter ginsenosidivorans TaxID=398053 RepID=A0A5B8UT93_9SPHI|nr:Rrf2 family transcriptional regulator [Mucilaginibacter ginsenosidivorans]QEC62327.1 Rrf2 family transcriptional regulator [Mucilaginibacter ginsenosidivorans]HVW95920.1 Rrf2 family transcriptional regulator [Mucilaginibacter sp.]